MCRKTIILAAMLIVMLTEAGALAGMAPKSAFGRYDTILTRKLFGEKPATPVRATPPRRTVPPPRNPDQGFALRMRITYLEKDQSGELVVGLYDDKTKWSATLKIGESQDGIELLDASYEDEKALVRKGTREEEISSRIVTRPGPPVSGETPYWQKRKVAREERVKKMRERISNQKPLTTEEKEALDKHLREYNMKLIRAGGDLGPPLPIRLTPEEDAQLVREGILPPVK